MTKFIPSSININTLSGGVGRQAQSKRMPSEAENLDNIYCTLERSAERRRGVEMVLNPLGGITPIGTNSNQLWFHWFVISQEHRFLIIVDRGASKPEDVITIYQLHAGMLSEVDASLITIDPLCADYLKHGTSFEQDTIKAVSVGSSLLLLNTEVKAGFTSDGVSTKTFGLGGEPSDVEDVIGTEVDYQTASSVDPRGIATIWTRYSSYLSGEQVIDASDSPTSGIYGIWQVDQNIGDSAVIGPENKPPSSLYDGDINKGNILDITLDPNISPVSGWTYYIKGGGVPHSDWGEFYLEDDYIESTSPTALTEIEGETQIRCVVGGSTPANLKWTLNKWTPVLDSEGVRRYTEFIAVKDNVYPDPDTPQLGQSVVDLTKLRLPPDSSDILDRNNAEYMLKNLYPQTGNKQGKGKVFYFAQTYGTTLPGYYRVKSIDKQPYLHSIRTPDKMSIIDKRRMPMQLAYIAETGEWILRTVGWDERTSGTVDSNPGPSPFRGADGSARQATIDAMSFYRDRLFLSSGDIMFTSRMGDFDNFWIADPGTIVSTDPIDLSVSSNKYSPITSMTPFNDYLFINTRGDTQFELVGSENQITPFTAEIAPTTFYSSIPELNPQLMGNQIYFFDSQRLYIYFGKAQTNINHAVDVSTHCPGYLPAEVGPVATSPAHNSIFFLGKENTNEIFTYINRFAGEQVVQNAFSKHILHPSTNIKHLETFDNYLYMICTLGTNNLYLQKVPIDTTDVDYTLPYLDNLTTAKYGTYSTTTNTTTYIVPFDCIAINKGVIDTAHEEAGRVFDVSSTTTGTNETTCYVSGDSSMYPLRLGSSYKSTVELSEQFIRDDQNNVVNGVLNLRSLSLRHNNSGAYDLNVTRRNKATSPHLFTPYVTGIDAVTPMSPVEADGEFLVRVFGLSNEIKITIESEYTTPFNITNIEFRGKFNKKDSLLERR